MMSKTNQDVYLKNTPWTASDLLSCSSGCTVETVSLFFSSSLSASSSRCTCNLIAANDVLNCLGSFLFCVRAKAASAAALASALNSFRFGGMYASRCIFGFDDEAAAVSGVAFNFRPGPAVCIRHIDG